MVIVSVKQQLLTVFQCHDNTISCCIQPHLKICHAYWRYSQLMFSFWLYIMSLNLWIIPKYCSQI